MSAANGDDKATRVPLGAGCDYVTAPEVSQMFGELRARALGDLWQRAGCPQVAYVELGPGRGTLAVDALRAMARAGLRPPVHLVENSTVLRSLPQERLPEAIWHADTSTLPDDVTLPVVCNEFFHALPICNWTRVALGRRVYSRGDPWG